MYFFAYDEFLEILPYINAVKESNYAPDEEAKFVRFIVENNIRYAGIDLSKSSKIMKEMINFTKCVTNEDKEESLNKISEIIIGTHK